MSEMPRQIVTNPGPGYKCWVEKRIYTGSMMSRYAGTYARCEKDPRQGHLTCWWHRKFEDEAQRLKTTDSGKTAERSCLERQVAAGLRSPDDLKKC